MAKLTDIIAGLEEFRSKGDTKLWIDSGNLWCVTFEMPQAYSSQLPTLIDRVAQQHFALQPQYEMQYAVEYQGE